MTPEERIIIDAMKTLLPFDKDSEWMSDRYMVEYIKTYPNNDTLKAITFTVQKTKETIEEGLDAGRYNIKDINDITEQVRKETVEEVIDYLHLEGYRDFDDMEIFYKLLEKIRSRFLSDDKQ